MSPNLPGQDERPSKRAYHALMARFAKERGAGISGRLRTVSLDAAASR
jgi:hypothetical protein